MMICLKCMRVIYPLLPEPTLAGPVFRRPRSALWRLLSTSTLTAAKVPSPSMVTLFVESEDWSERIADAVSSNFVTTQQNEGGKGISDIWLPHPGSSPLTRTLLGRTDCSVVAWERRTSHLDHLEGLLMEFGSERFQLKRRYFVGDSSFEMEQESSAVKTGGNIAIVGFVPRMDLYISRLLFAASGDVASVWHPGRVQHYLYASGLEYKLMTEGEQMWTTSPYQRCLLYSLFFTARLLFTIPMTAFSKISLSAPDPVRAMKCDPDNMYLTSLVVRPDLFHSVCSATDLPRLVRLLKLAARKKNHRVIPTLERWCPDIGLSLIEHGVSMLDRFKDVNISSWPSIYRSLVSSRHYDYSALRLLLEGDTALRRLEQAASDGAAAVEDMSSSSESNLFHI